MSFDASQSPENVSLMIFRNMTQCPLVSSGDVSLWGLNGSRAELGPCSCDMAVKSIRPGPSSLHHNTHHCIGMYWSMMNESLSVWLGGRTQWRHNVISMAFCGRWMTDQMNRDWRRTEIVFSSKSTNATLWKYFTLCRIPAFRSVLTGDLLFFFPSVCYLGSCACEESQSLKGQRLHQQQLFCPTESTAPERLISSPVFK